MLVFFFFATRFLQCGAGSGFIALKKLDQVLLRSLLTVEECFKEICLMVIVFTCFSSASVFFKDVLDGCAVDRLGFSSFLALLAQISALSLLATHAPE